MTILFDVDGVCADLHTTWLNRYNKDYDDDLTPASIYQWELADLVKPECGVKIFEYLDASIYDEVLPIPGALTAVEYARKWSRVVFVTTPTEAHRGAKLDWLNRHEFDVHRRDYVECHDKSLVRGDVLIDDCPDNLLDFVGLPVLFDRPWNQSSWLRRIRGFDDNYQKLLRELYK